ncbi:MULTISPECIES: DUF58 domain-containing protein [unclassified Thioalkalivibrio]|uniref:DUF58 domain-containing protein n=1 Tax=unclassified Thioalkalivibrio TaxID=2621013 RepID=UPI0003A93AE9|nr:MULTISPECIES: DUF58 domain-containing protein [unclassified Thioalkalivibrio]
MRAGSLGKHLPEGMIRWVTRRHRADGAQTTLGRDRIYILPTRAGYTLLAILGVMLLGAINYSNNMAFLLTFLLVGIGHNAIWYTHRNLLGLKVSALSTTPVFAGQPLSVSLRLEDTRGRDRESLHLSIGGYTSEAVAVPANGRQVATVPLPVLGRGVYRLPRQHLGTRYPLGILNAWSWLGLTSEMLVYPQPVDPGAAHTGLGDEAGVQRRQDDASTPDHIRPYRPGDPPGRILWKALARTGKLHIRETVEGARDTFWIDWSAMPASDTETRLSMLCHQILAAEAEGRAWGLRLPDQILPPGRGPAQRERGLRALAEYRFEPIPLPIPETTRGTKK